jgi:hypothetical protein
MGAGSNFSLVAGGGTFALQGVAKQIEMGMTRMNPSHANHRMMIL